MGKIVAIILKSLYSLTFKSWAIFVIQIWKLGTSFVRIALLFLIAWLFHFWIVHW